MQARPKPEGLGKPTMKKPSEFLLTARSNSKAFTTILIPFISCYTSRQTSHEVGSSKLHLARGIVRSGKQMLLMKAVRLPHIPIFDKPSLSDTVSTCREYKPTALNGKVKPCPPDAHPVWAGLEFIQEPRIFLHAVQGRLSMRIALTFGGVSAFVFALCGWRCVRSALGGGLLGSVALALRFARLLRSLLSLRSVCSLHYIGTKKAKRGHKKKKFFQVFLML